MINDGLVAYQSLQLAKDFAAIVVYFVLAAHLTAALLPYALISAALVDVVFATTGAKLPLTFARAKDVCGAVGLSFLALASLWVETSDIQSWSAFMIIAAMSNVVAVISAVTPYSIYTSRIE